MRKQYILCLLISCVLLSACQQEVFEACVHQPFQNVAKIELLAVQDDEKTVLYTVEQDELSFVWDTVTNFNYGKFRSEPATEYGDLAVRIYYQDGFSDIIGIRSNRYLDPDGNMAQSDYGYYLLDKTDFYDLFSRYVDSAILP